MTRSVTDESAVPPRCGGESTLNLTEPSVHSLHFEAAMAVGPVTTVARRARATVPVTATKALFNPGIVISLGYRGHPTIGRGCARQVHAGEQRSLAPKDSGDDL